MSTSSLTAPTRTRPVDEASGLNHYALKAAITEAIVLGTTARTLCGETVTPRGQGAQSSGALGTARTDWDSCPLCRVIYEGLRG